MMPVQNSQAGVRGHDAGDAWVINQEAPVSIPEIAVRGASCVPPFTHP
jgi:hypothetical protein